jgi:predicted nuclease with RNAse H fold
VGLGSVESASAASRQEIHIYSIGVLEAPRQPLFSDFVLRFFAASIDGPSQWTPRAACAEDQISSILAGPRANDEGRSLVYHPFMERLAIGIDVGGRKKGFHAALIQDNDFEVKQLQSVEEALDWCKRDVAAVVAIDAPCMWSVSSNSRKCERELNYKGSVIQCFKTPTRDASLENDFYMWVHNGAELYERLRSLPRCEVIETFPYAIHCFLEGTIYPRQGQSKVRARRTTLSRIGYDITNLTNTDYVDAALCAHVAQQFDRRKVWKFGDDAEGYIYVPNS